VLKLVKEINCKLVTKSGLMLGLGESYEEVVDALRELRSSGCDVITLGQYLKPRAGKLDVKEFVSPEVFLGLAEEGRKLGFREVFSGPFVRSSYHADEVYDRSRFANAEAK
jgi:lipoic acid synthetase